MCLNIIGLLSRLHTQIEPVSGVYAECVDLHFASATPEAEIVYTLDDSRPGPNSTRFVEPVRISRIGLTVVRARAMREGMWISDEARASYTVVMQVINRKHASLHSKPRDMN
jgi:hypothetical protein